MTINLTNEQEQPAVEQVQQATQQPAKAPISANDFQLGAETQPAPQAPQQVQQTVQPQYQVPQQQIVQQPTVQYVVPQNMATKDDIAVVSSLVQKTMFDSAIQQFQTAHPDHVDVKEDMLQILDKNPALWDTGYDNALNFAYAAAKANRVSSATAQVQAQTAQNNQQIAATANMVSNLNNPTVTNPLNQQQQEEDYNDVLLRHAKGSSLF